MTNVVQFPTPANDDGDGGEHPLADVCRKFMQDCVDAARELALRHQAIQQGYKPAMDVWDYRDANRYALVTLRNEARGFLAKWTKKGEDLGLPDEIIAMIVPQAAPIMATLDRSISDNLDAKRPSTRYASQPSTKHPLRWAEIDPPLPLKKENGGWTLTFVVWGLIAFAAVIILAANSGPSSTYSASTYSPSASSSSSSGPSVWPYFWAGIHNGRVSHGFGVRGGGRRHH